MTLALCLEDIKKCKSKHIALQGRGLRNGQAKAIVEAINNNKHIIEVDLSKNNLDDDCLAFLCELKHVKKIDLSQNNFDKGALTLMKQFTYLDISHNFVSEETAQQILKSLKTERHSCSTLLLKDNELPEALLGAINSKISENNAFANTNSIGNSEPASRDNHSFLSYFKSF